jgi:DNA-directed RNA polymerase specialized sigma24 family protein
VNARELLERIEKIDTMIENKNIEKILFKDSISCTASSFGGEKVQSSRNIHKMEDNIVKYLDFELDIDSSIAQLREERKEIISLIEQLPTAYYDVLHKLYVQRLSFKEIAFKCKKSESWATTVHGRALKALQKILDEREEKAKCI